MDYEIQPIPRGLTISKSLFKAQSSKLEGLFLLKRGKRDIRALSFEPRLPKMSPQVGLAVYDSSKRCKYEIKVEWHKSRANQNGKNPELLTILRLHFLAVTATTCGECMQVTQRLGICAWVLF